jgi:phosphatidylglycerophosphate synthase
MFDTQLRRLIDPPLNKAGTALARRGVSANTVTLVGFAFGLGAAGMIAVGAPLLALLPLLLCRIADGLDGAVARASPAQPTSFGGFLDITFDFFFYGAVPFAFAVMDPAVNALPAAFLLFSFYANGTAFLAFAILAEKRGLETAAQGQKSLYYVSGLLEGGETIAFFVALCLMPDWFAPLAWGFGTLCIFSACLRVVLAARVFR